MADITKKEKKRLYDIEYRKNNPEKIKQKQIKDYSERKKRFIENPAKYLWATARSRAKQKGIEFCIEVEDIPIHSHCPISGKELTKGDGYDPNAMSLDRVDNSLGYVKGNVQVISRIMNLKKSNMTIDDLNNIINYIKSYTN